MKFFIFLFCICFEAFSQFKPINKVGTAECSECKRLIEKKPKEILFGIEIKNNSEVFFVLNDAAWFDKVWINPKYSLAVELIPKSNFNCQKTLVSKSKWIEPLTYPELKKNRKIEKNRLKILVGKVPKELQSEELEGNLAILVSGKICFYNTFLNLESAKWELLPMGFYGNEITEISKKKDVKPSPQMIEFSIPFQKNAYQLDEKYKLEISHILEKNKGGSIEKIEIQAKASVEGSFEENTILFNKRALVVKKMIDEILRQNINIQVFNDENWDDFFADIAKTKYSYLSNESKEGIKSKLQNSKLQAELEPLLKNHRTTKVRLYLTNPKQKFEDLLVDYKNAILNNDAQIALNLQEEIFNLSTSPEQYLKKIEIPDKRIFADLLNNELLYKLNLGLENEEVTLAKFQKLLAKDPKNIKFNYNVVALKILLFALKKPIEEIVLLKEINNLESVGINKNLVQRMLINYHQILAEKMLEAKNYRAKDHAIISIKNVYKNLSMSELDALFLSKMLASFDLDSESKLILEPYLSKTKNEDLLFYYLNLIMLSNENLTAEINEIAGKVADLNNQRFCDLFKPISENGISFQLLANESLRKIYCSKCK